MRSVCPYCGVGCGLSVEVDGSTQQVSRVRGDDGNRGTLGKLCRKAVYLPQAINTPDRLGSPRVRSRLDEPFLEADWEVAIGSAAQRLGRILERYGPESVAFYLSGQLLTEDYYVANKLAKGFLNTPHVDSNSRLCMSSAVVAYQKALGRDGPPCSYADFDDTECVLLVGSNTADCHPVLFQRILQRKAANPSTTIIAIDPRRTATARQADLHLQLRPGTDVPLLLGLLRALIHAGHIDRAFIDRHTLDWPAVERSTQAWTIDRTSEVTGVAGELIERAAHVFGAASAAMSCWAMGVNQSVAGVDASLALINLHLATGQIGRPGSGPFSLTGQPNAMGGREVGALAGLLPGHRALSHARDLEAIAAIWGVPIDRLPTQRGLTGVEIFQALADGRLKAIWIAATNPMVSMPDLRTVEAGLRRAELVVVQDAYFPTETAQLAHMVLPAAQWAEKEGTTTSSERRISYMSAVVPPVRMARPDWQIFAELGRRLGHHGFEYPCAEAVFDEHRRCTVGTDMDIGGLSYARLQRDGGIQWPCPTTDHPGTSRLYSDRKFGTADGRARFVAPVWREPSDRTAIDRPLVLLTGRERDQWHTMTRTGQVPQLLKSCPEPYLAIHPADAASLGIVDGEWTEIDAPDRGSLILRARVADDVQRGAVFAPFHWGGLRHAGGPLNAATSPELDPASHQPGLKFAAVRVRRIDRSMEEPSVA